MVWSFYCSGTLDESVVLGIFVASLRAVGCAATLAAAGLWLARRGLMSPSLSKGLSQLSVKLAIPALLFSSMVPGISFELLGYAWPLLLLPAVYLLLGLLIGGLMLLLVRPPADFRLSTVAACTFGNTTGIPVVLLSVIQQSLSRSVFADIADPLLFLSIELVMFPLLQVRARVPLSTLSTRVCRPLSLSLSLSDQVCTPMCVSSGSSASRCCALARAARRMADGAVYAGTACAAASLAAAILRRRRTRRAPSWGSRRISKCGQRASRRLCSGH